MTSSDLSLGSNTWSAASESRMLRLTAQGIYSDEYKNPFELLRVALSTLRDDQRAVVQRLKENVATAETEMISQQIKMQLSQAEKALANYEDELKKVAQLCHQLITRILDAIR